jgi:hypothetical protein
MLSGWGSRGTFDFGVNFNLSDRCDRVKLGAQRPCRTVRGSSTSTTITTRLLTRSRATGTRDPAEFIREALDNLLAETVQENARDNAVDLLGVALV